MIVVNPDDNLVEEITSKLKENGGYCPCSIIHVKATKCMCKDFRDKIKNPDFFGQCHCGLYIKKEDPS